MRAWVHNVPILQRPMAFVLDVMAFWVLGTGAAAVVNMVNTYSLVEANRNRDHLDALLASSINVADGWPVARMARTPRIAGTDLMLAAARHPVLGKCRHVLLGGFGSAYRAAIRQFREAEATLVGIHPPFVPEVPSGARLIEMANAVTCDILWVALGCPKQELWMHHYRYDLPARVVVGVGAAFDYLANTRTRAPLWAQQAGLEGFWRIAAERGTWRRQWRAAVGLTRLLLK